MSLIYNLQFFASDGPGGEKTEAATQKKLSDARKEGQVAKSKEIANAFGLLSLFLILRYYTGRMGILFIEFFHEVYEKIPIVTVFWQGNLSERDLMLVLRDMFLKIIVIVAPIFIIAFLVAFLCDIIQVKWQISGKPLQPKLNRLDPIKGFKKIFSMNSIVELIKAIAKIILIVYISYKYALDRWQQLFLFYDMPFMQSLQLILEIVTDLGIKISLIYMIIAFSDYFYQKFKFGKDMRMTKQEIKEEYKQQEGDPQIKGKIRQRMREASQRRMMQELPKADVVITNPTHYAVAIKYDAELSDAPIVIAKGADFLAAKIKEVAKENKIEIVENKPLARMLFANVEVGQSVPPELYQAVAEVLAFVYKLQGKI